MLPPLVHTTYDGPDMWKLPAEGNLHGSLVDFVMRLGVLPEAKNVICHGCAG